MIIYELTQRYGMHPKLNHEAFFFKKTQAKERIRKLIKAIHGKQDAEEVRFIRVSKAFPKKWRAVVSSDIFEIREIQVQTGKPKP